tara:strand:- start:3885 stop:5156 length:1272 start_codon:yes stop_codon:yes gene_type:complete
MKLNSKIYSTLKQGHFLRNSILFFKRGPVFNLTNKNFRYILTQSIKRKNINELNIDYSIEHTKKYIDKGIEWLINNQLEQDDGGISGDITFSFGRTILGGSFPEVTGYIIPTLFDYASLFNNSIVREGAIRAANFELPFQDENGAFPGGDVGNLTGPSIFNSAQIVHGLVRAYKETKNQKYIDACIKSCDWIVKMQEKDGSWKRHNYNNIKRTYDTKVAQPLLETADVVGDNRYVESAKRNLKFVLLNQKKNGWFYNCDNSIERNDAPLMHLIGYTVQGLLVCYSFLKDEELLESSICTLNQLMHKYEISKKPLAGRYYSNWKAAVKSSCVTGDAQISLCWMDIFEITGDYAYLNSALKMNDFLKSILFNCSDKKVNGALPQSYPVWGEYGPYKIVSWGTKYFIDALIQEYKIKTNILEGKYS